MRTRIAILALLTLLVVTALPGTAVAGQNRTTPTTVPAQAGAATAGANPQAADCIGCVAAWGLWDLGTKIRGLRESRANEVVNRIHVHGSIIKAFQNKCTGDWRFGEAAENFSKTAFNTSTNQVHDKQYTQGSQKAWGNAGAHEWDEDGVFWGYGGNGESDICKTF